MSQYPWDDNKNTAGSQGNGSQASGSPAYGSSQGAAHQPETDQTVPLNTASQQNYQGQYQQGSANGGYAQNNAYGYNTNANNQQWNNAAYPAYGQTATQTKKKHTSSALLSAALIAALVGGGVGAGSSMLVDHEKATVTTSNAGTTIVNNTDSVNEVTAAAQKATPSVVTIGASSGSTSGSGSGIILDSEGHILTNTHVVTLDGAANNAKIEVQMSDGTVKKATIVGTDPTNDLAVIKIDTSGMNITPATLGDSGKLNVGDTVLAIGAPLGLQNTVTDGIISTLSRTIEIASSEAPSQDSQQSESDPFSSQDSPFQFQLPGQEGKSSSSQSTIAINVLQTDAAVNPGNSGGALVNSKGEVIGVNVAIASAGSSSSSNDSTGNIGVGFAIPINDAKRIAQEIIDNGKATHGYLGASVATSPGNDDSSEQFGDGAVIKNVTNGGAADKAGLKEGDVITEFNGKKISEATELTAAVRSQAAGSTVTVRVQRGSSTKEMQVTLGNADDAK